MTRPGMTRPGTPPPPPPPLPGRQVATVPPRRRFRPGWKRGILLGVGAIVVLLVFWLYLGYRSFSNEIAKANARLDHKTEKALTPAGNILTQPAGDAGARLRQPRRRQHRPRRLDRPDAHRPGQAPDQHAVDPARPLRHHPRPRPHQDQRRLRLRRGPAPDPYDQLADRPAGEPHRAGQLRRLQGADRLAGRRHALQQAQDRLVPAVRRSQLGVSEGHHHARRPQGAGLLPHPPHHQPAGHRHHPHRAPAAGDAVAVPPAGVVLEPAAPARRSAARWPSR